MKDESLRILEDLALSLDDKATRKQKRMPGFIPGMNVGPPAQVIGECRGFKISSSMLCQAILKIKHIEGME